MRRKFLLPLVLIFLSAAGCDGFRITTIPVDDRVLPDDVAAQYREDAARLALRHLDATTDLAFAPAEIPEELWQSLYNALARVWNADFGAHDQLATIHTFPNPQIRRLLVRFDGAPAWTEAWKRGETLTGNAEIDALLERYQLVVEKYYDWSIGNYVVLVATGEPLNLERVARELLEIEGILLAEPEGVAGDGDDITAEPAGNAWRLTFHAKWGDCPAGCTAEHWWRFAVLGDGTVRFDGEGGNDFPRRWQSIIPWRVWKF